MLPSHFVVSLWPRGWKHIHVLVLIIGIILSLYVMVLFRFIIAAEGASISNIDRDHVQCENMLMASFIGDAATMPVHWVYDQQRLKVSIRSDSNLTSVLYHSHSICPFYSYPTGVFSPYGDESVPLVYSMTDNPTRSFSKQASAKSMRDFFER